MMTMISAIEHMTQISVQERADKDGENRSTLFEYEWFIGGMTVKVTRIVYPDSDEELFLFSVPIRKDATEWYSYHHVGGC